MKRHPLDLVSLVAGGVFVAIAVASLVGGLDSIETQTRVVWPTALIAIGLAILFGNRRSGPEA